MFNPKKLKEFREANGFSKTSLMFELDKINFRVSRQTLINWEDGKTYPNAKEIGELAAFYNIPVSEFFKV